ncbi:MAG TPA: ethanolamine utilization protein EutN [Myxococcales bacterium]|nr:ethanolamine utilization protein EutN [Myxococcales bacterium]
MIIGRVVGTLVATRKEEELVGLKLLLVREIDQDLNVVGKMVVAADAVGAGVGEVVLYVAGSSARQTRVTENRPVDHTIMAIVDTFEVDGEVRYDKRQDV